MRTRLIIPILTVFLITNSCNKKINSIEQAWLIETLFTGSHTLLSFSDTICTLVRFDQTIENPPKKIVYYKWDIKNDTLILGSKDKQNESKYKIDFLSKDSLIIGYLSGDEYFHSPKNKFKPITKTNIKYSKQDIDKILIYNSFAIQTHNKNSNSHLDFITKDKCIDYFDSLLFQIDKWEIQSIDNEFYFYSSYPTGTTIFHLISIDTNKIILEFTNQGLQIIDYKKIIPNTNPNTRKILIKSWHADRPNIDDPIPLPPVIPGKEFYDGLCYHFSDDGIYYYKSGYFEKKGIWELSKSKRYILLDSISNNRQILMIDKIDSSKLVLMRRDYRDYYNNMRNKIEMIELQ